MASHIPPMVEPSFGTTAVFVTIVLTLAVGFVFAIRHAATVAGANPSRATLYGALGMSLWLVGTALVARSGVLEGHSLPPPAMVYLVACNLFIVLLAFSPVGTLLVRGVPIALLVGFQGFRLPLELVLHQWYGEGVLPVQMTYSGHNFDIVSGIAGLMLGVALWRGRAGWPAILAFNVVGFGLLLTVATIAVLSSPLPIRMYFNDPAVLLVFHAPYTWIVSMCVSGALFGHLLVFRWLVRHRPGVELGSESRPVPGASTA